MGTRRPTGDRVPFGDLTNTTHGGLVPPNGDRNEKKRQRERERYATISGENSSEINKKRRERYAMNSQGRVDLNSNMAAHSTDGNTTNEIDENSEWLHMHSTHNNGVGQLSDSNTRNEMGENSDRLHRQSTYSSSLEQLSDGQVSLSNIGGTGDLDDINTEHDISTVYETGSGYAPSPINQVVTCPKERRNAHDRARRAAMSPQQKALLNKRRRELYATKNAPKKSAKMLQMTSKETAQSTDGPIPLSIGIPGDIDDTLTETDTNIDHETDGPIPLRIEVPSDIDDTLAETDINTVYETGVVNASRSIDNFVTCPKERKHELDRARRATMSPEQKAQINKRRRELYTTKNAARKLQMTPQEKKLKRKEINKKYNMAVREHRANNLHPDSIAMESPHFNPQLIFPSSPQSPEAPSQDMEIPETGARLLTSRHL